MNKSDNISNLAKALSAAQGKLKSVIPNCNNPFFKSRYADLSACWDACRDELAKNGLSVVQTNDASETGVVIDTTLLHVSGEWISGRLFLPLAKQDAQAVVAANTYGRRTALCGILGLCADQDDDGNKASGKSAGPSVEPPPTDSDAAPSGALHSAVGVLQEVSAKEGKNKKGQPWKRFGLKVNDQVYGTFDEAIGDAAENFRGETVCVEWRSDGKYKTAVGIALVRDATAKKDDDNIPF